jgi:hypothetical protein
MHTVDGFETQLPPAFPLHLQQVSHPSHTTPVAILDQFEHLDHVAQQDVRSLLAAASPYSTTNEVERKKINICTLIF